MSSINFGAARSIEAESFGLPGQRTFRLRVLGAAGESASLWLEKEHLQVLSLALRQVLWQLKYQGAPQAAALGDFPDVATYDFRVERMALGFDPADRLVVLQADELGSAEEDGPTIRLRLADDQCASLVVQLDRIIAGGRQVCPLCGLAIDTSGHPCVRSNGHSQQPVPDADSGNEDS